MAFQMECPHCKQKLHVTEKAFGKLLPCPGCSKPFEVPQPPASSSRDRPVGHDAAPQRVSLPIRREETAPRQPAHAPAPTHGHPPRTLASCPRCGQSFQAGNALAGKMVQCPRCMTQLQMPGGGVPAPAVQPFVGSPARELPAGEPTFAAPPITAPPTVLGSLSLLGIVATIALLSSFVGSVVAGPARSKPPTNREQNQEASPGTQEPATAGAVHGSLSATDLESTMQRGREHISEARSHIAAARRENEGNDIAVRSAIERARAESRKKVEQEFAAIQGQNVTWRFTVSKIAQYFNQVIVDLRESPGTGPGANEAGLYILFGDDGVRRNSLLVGKEVSTSLAEKLRPGDVLIVKGRARISILNENFDVEIRLLDVKVESADVTIQEEKNAREQKE